MDDVKEFVGETREDAISRAAQHFGVSQDQLWVHVVPDEPPVSGLGGRVLVLASIPEDGSAPRPAPRRERSERGDRGERRDRGDRPERGERRTRGERGGRRGERERAPERAPERREPPAPPVIEGKLGPVGEFVAGVLTRLGVSAPHVSETADDSGDVLVTLGGDSISELDSRDDRVLAAISHLADRVAEKRLEEGCRARVEMAGGGGGERRPRREREDRGPGRSRGGRAELDDETPREEIDEEALETLAREAAARVRETGEPQLLRAMSSKERWVVHNALKDEDGIRSESEGEGRTRRVKLVPA